jgi:hypothetical protein
MATEVTASPSFEVRRGLTSGAGSGQAGGTAEAAVDRPVVRDYKRATSL